LPLLLLPAAREGVYLALFVGIAILTDGLVQRALRTRARGKWLWALAPVSLGPIFWARLDVFVAAAGVAFVLYAERGRWGRAGAALAVMGLLKLWPLLLLLAVLPAVPARFRARFTSGAALTLTVALLPLVLLGAGEGLLHVLRFHSDRGIEIEAVAAVPLNIAASLGHGPSLQHLYGCFQFATPGWARTALGFALVWAILLSGVLARRLRTDGPQISLLVAVVLVLVSSKVLSPQYFVWAAAAVALAIDKHPRPAQLGYALVGALLSAQVVFPFLFVHLLLAEPGAVVVAATHGIAVVALALAAIVPLLAKKTAAGPPSDGALR
jgi:hypothetical protein